ncbi:MAG: hypothetical protein ACTSQE_15600 [Candidatus Heimdallarchaeaceae archaeon]
MSPETLSFLDKENAIEKIATVIDLDHSIVHVGRVLMWRVLISLLSMFSLP